MYKVTTIAAITNKELIRSRLFLGFGFVTLLFILSMQVLQQIELGASTERFMLNLGFGGISLFGSLLCIIISVQTIYSEIESRTLIPLLTKPIGWFHLLIGKFIAMWFLLGLYLLVLGSVLFTFIFFEKADSFQLSIGDFAIVLFGEWLFFGIILSAGILVSSYTSSGMFAMIILSLFWILGHVQHILASLVKKDDPSFLEYFLGAFQWIIPNFQIFHLSELLARGGLGSVSTSVTFFVALIFIITYLVLSRFFLSIREL